VHAVAQGLDRDMSLEERTFLYLPYMHSESLVVHEEAMRLFAAMDNADILDYVERNHFFENYRGPGDDFFGSVGSKPEIYPVYWSSAQMEARQSDRMARVQSFLNHRWTYESDGVRWFDPERDSG
jgi:hypothetical protein